MMLSLFFICLAVLQVSVVRVDNAIRVHPKLTWAHSTGSGEPFIIGGEPAVEGQFPWQVTLSDSWYSCGGAVLSHSFVLTAAHCLHDASIKNLVISFGSLLYLDMKVSRRAAELIIHENFFMNSTIMINDIALIRLDSKLPEEWTALLAPISLPRLSHVSQLDDETVDVSGWGSISFEHVTAHYYLQWTRMKVMPLASCSEMFIESNNSGLTEEHICTNTSGGHSAYKGDSGSPLVWRDAEDIPRVVGIVSFGFDDKEPDDWRTFPNVFTRVSHFLDWIQKHSDVVVEPLVPWSHSPTDDYQPATTSLDAVHQSTIRRR